MSYYFLVTSDSENIEVYAEAASYADGKWWLNDVTILRGDSELSLAEAHLHTHDILLNGEEGKPAITTITEKVFKFNDDYGDIR